jgi:hypothetical protein
MSSIWGMTPRASIEAARQERCQKNLVALGVQVLNGRELDGELGYVLAGPLACRDVRYGRRHL